MEVCWRSPGTSWFFQNFTSKQAPPFQPSIFRPSRCCGGLQIGLVLDGPERPQSSPSCPGKQLNQPHRPIGHIGPPHGTTWPFEGPQEGPWGMITRLQPHHRHTEPPPHGPTRGEMMQMGALIAIVPAFRDCHEATFVVWKRFLPYPSLFAVHFLIYQGRNRGNRRFSRPH